MVMVVGLGGGAPPWESPWEEVGGVVDGGRGAGDGRVTMGVCWK